MKDNIMQELVVIRGLPGSGKSTYAKKHFASEEYDHFENDIYFMHGNEYKFDERKAKDAANWCFYNTSKSLLSGRNVVVSNVFVTCKAISRYKELADDVGANFRVVRLEADFGNVHDVPDKVYKSMKSCFQDWPGEEVVTQHELEADR